MRRSILAATCALVALALNAPGAQASFGFKPGDAGFSVSALAEGGEPASQAGSHPYGLSLQIGFNETGPPGVGSPEGDLRELEIELPTGMLIDPSMVNTSAFPTCAAAVFNTPRSSPFGTSHSGEDCPAASQVGVVDVHSDAEGGATRRFGVFNVEPPHGAAAALGFAPYGTPILFGARLRAQADGRYSVSLAARDIPQTLSLHDLEVTIWGAPWATVHDGQRGDCLNEAKPDFPWAKCPVPLPVGSQLPAYLTLPLECSGSLSFTAAARSWQGSEQVTRAASNRDESSQEVPVDSCMSVSFAPQVSATLTNRRASSPSGFELSLTQNTAGLTAFAGRAPAPPRTVDFVLPEGVTINPSVGAGLGACSPAQYAAETAYNGQGAGCPNAAKLGSFEVRTPLFAGEPLIGAIYLASPDEPRTAAPGAENPFDELIALYLIAKSAKRGLLVKIAGEISADPQSGRLTAVFEDLPQLPYSQVSLSFHHGQRPFLATPPFCGTAPTQVQLVPWAGASSASSSTPSPIDAGIDGPCPSGATPPFAPDVVTGGVNAQVGAYTPYFVHLSRKDTEQEITSYSLVLPRGITGKLAGIPFCSDEAIAAARQRRGFEEIADPSCPAASQVGRTDTGYGVGAALAYAPGKIYLAGPYHGRPLSLVSINAATIGPFDLGTYVIRSAFALDPRTAQLQIDAGASDPIPHIVDGIPLHVRDIRVYMDRFEFTHNPSSCAASELVSTLTGSGARVEDPADDSTATVSRHFQLFNCAVLGFRPKLGLRLRGGNRRGSYPSLRATFAARGPQDSNLKQIEVITPRSMFLANEHIRAVCTRPQFEAERCPRGSAYGRAVVHTSLFDTPLRGPVFLRSSSGRLPDLVASLRSGSVRIILEGRIGPAKGGIRTFFRGLPDAPIERFTMTLFGGRRGLLVNSTNVCRRPPRASVKALGQNNLGAIFESTLRGQCAKKQAKGGRR